jgi:hypothetical protein
MDEALVLAAVRELEADGIPVTIESLAAYLHWPEQRVHIALVAPLLDRRLYVIGPFLHVTPDGAAIEDA